MHPPKITVYITNYNYGKFIRDSIESVLNQTLQDFELLIIDDGSTDNSGDIIEEYRSYEKVTIIYQKNKGLNVTNNIAMRAARGIFIMRLDADDFLAPDALQTMSDILTSDSELGLVFPDYFYVDAEGNTTGEEKRHDFEKEVSLFDQPAHGACTMIRLEFLKQVGGYNESFTCQDGYDLWIKFIMHFKVTNVSKPLFYYRRHGNNLTSNEERILSTRKQIKELFVKENFSIPSVLAVIPVRNAWINGINWPLFVVNGKSMLEHKIEILLKATYVKELAISSSESEILEHLYEIKHKYKGIHVIERPLSYAQASETLYRTIDQVLEVVQLSCTQEIEMILTASLEYPFVTSDVIDDAINTLLLFKTDSVLSVRPDDKTYYQHTGHSLKPILNHDRFTRLEREALYKGAAGIAVSMRKSFAEKKQMVSGSIGHVVVDSKSAFSVTSPFEFELFKKMYQ